MSEEIEPRSCSNCGRSEIKGNLTSGFFRECELQDEKIHTTYVPEDFFCNYWIPWKENPEKQRKQCPCGGTPEIRVCESSKYGMMIVACPVCGLSDFFGSRPPHRSAEKCWEAWDRLVEILENAYKK